MLDQAAACLVLDIDKGAMPSGCWTVATTFGDRLIQRRMDRVGLSFELVSDLQGGFWDPSAELIASSVD